MTSLVTVVRTIPDAPSPPGERQTAQSLARPEGLWVTGLDAVGAVADGADEVLEQVFQCHHGGHVAVGVGD